jgi:galactonate dehydratase
LATLPVLTFIRRLEAMPRLRITAYELLPVRATERTVWLFLRLKTDAGISGLGEASDAFGFANTSKQDAARMESEFRSFFQLVEGKSPLDVEAYREQGFARAASGLTSATAFSAIEQALWDLAGKALDVPAYSLFGGRLRATLPVYANINRATKARTPAGFAETAKAAVKDGFRSIKGAPWDGFPPAGAAPQAVAAAVDLGIACTAAMRDAVGPDVAVMVDCHSNFDPALAKSVAARLEPYNLAWYEEPVPPERVVETVDIHRAIKQPMAAGEVLFRVKGFEALCRERAVDVIMPDVKHCGGLLELTRIAAMAAADGLTVAPHNPSGPVSTAASVQICAPMANFKLLELQWGEVAWRSDVIDPPERFVQGNIAVPDRPGFGITLNDRVVKAHPL